MAAEGARHGIFRIGTQPREAASMIAPPPAKPETKPQPSPSRQPDNKRPTLTPEKKPKNKLLGRLLLVGGLTVFAAGITGTVIKLTEGSSQQTEASASFDPSKDEGTMGPSNTIFVPIKELDNYPDFDEKGNPLIVVAASEDKEIGYRRQKRWGASKPGEENFRNFLIQTGIPAGTTIPAPHDGYLFIYLSTPDLKKDSVLQGFKVFFLSPEGKLMWLDTNVYTGPEEARGSVKQLISSVPNYLEASRTGDPNWWKQGLPVERGEPVLSTERSINYVYAIGAALNGVMSSENAVLGDMSPLTTSSNSTTQKLVAVK